MSYQDKPAEYLPARNSAVVSYDARNEQELFDYARRSLASAGQPPPLPPKPAHLTVGGSQEVETVFLDDQGRKILARSMVHNGRPASVLVQLDEAGKPTQILSGTARLPGETDRQYFRQMSSFAGWQLKPTSAHKGISLHGDQKYPFFCIVVIVITFVLLLVEIAENGWTLEPFEVNPVFGPTREVLIRLGAKKTDLIVNQGQGYRLISAFWLHGGILHWIINMLALINLGFSLEREFGTPKIMLVFLACGFMGVLTSAVFSPETVGVGASGAIFGLFGVAWADLIQNWGLYRARKEEKCLLAQLVVGTVINILLGFAPMLDQFAHMGGLFTGLFLGFALTMEKRFTRFGEKKPWGWHQRFLQVGGLLAALVGFITLLSLLFSGMVSEGWCSWCTYVNCIPIPGAWTCDATGCADSPVLTGEPFVFNSTMLITCPSLQQVWTPISSVPTSADLIAFCQQLCQD